MPVLSKTPGVRGPKSFGTTSNDLPLKSKMMSAGLAGCVSDLITFPLDLAKVRLQIQGEGSTTVGAVLQQKKYRSMFHTISTVAREEGPRSLYNGLTPGLQRQLAFCAVRIGMYDTIKNMYLKKFKAENGGGSVLLRILAGATTGILAVMVAQPTDVVKVRMQAQAAGEGVRYTGCMQAYTKIATEEGVRGLWKGCGPNCARMIVVNAAELVSYDLIKEKILSMGLLSDNLPCHFVSAFGAGFCTTVVASPVDVVKTRFMNSAPGVYKGAFDCALRMLKDNGPLAFYKGFTPNFVRLAAWNVCMFVSYEQIKRAFYTAHSIPAKTHPATGHVTQQSMDSSTVPPQPITQQHDIEIKSSVLPPHTLPSRNELKDMGHIEKLRVPTVYSNQRSQ